MMRKMETGCRIGLRLLRIIALVLVTAFAASAGATDQRAINSKLAPVYPELAKRMKISGLVKLEVTVDPEGRVTEVKTLSGTRALSTAAEDAVRKWRFVPGTAVSTLEMEINFDLPQ
jgi:TonB family protein